MTGLALDQPPLSWQQETYLGEPADRRHDNVWVSFPLPAEVSDDEVVRRIARMVEREESLRGIGSARDGVTYARTVALPVRHARCADPAELSAFVAEHKRTRFAPGEPLWNLTVISGPAAGGRVPRTVLAVFEHLVADMVSLALLRRELCTGVEPSAERGAGRYREWVTGQRAEFDARAAAPTAARACWRDHLGATAPTRWTPTPGVLPAAPGRGRGTTWVSVRVPLSDSDLRTAARNLRATPQILAVASVAATLAEGSGESDLTLRLHAHGRTPASAATFGWLAVLLPIRVRHPRLREFPAAVSAVRAGWRQTLRHQHTPWAYLCTAITGAGGGPAGHRPFSVNFFPEPVGEIGEPDLADQHDDRAAVGLALKIVALTAGGLMFRMALDSDDVDLESARRLLYRLAGDFVVNVRTGTLPEGVGTCQ